MENLQNSPTFPSITMDKKALSDMFLQKMYSVVEIAEALNMHCQLRKLELFVGHLEGNCHFGNQVAEMLKLAFYEAEQVVEEHEVFIMRNQLIPRSRSSKVHGFFSYRLNLFAYRIRMFLEIRKLIKKLDKIGRYRNAAIMVGHGGFMHTRASVRYTGIVGRDSDRDIVVEMLLKSGNEDTLFVFPIVGVGGIGKTTLAKLVYNDPRIGSHFQLHLWVHVSHAFKLKTLLEQIVNSVRKVLCENLGMNELQKLVRETLYEKNYLVVLDDVWNEYPVKWDELKKLLIVGSCGSKILVTTRNEAVALLMGTVPAYCLKGLLSEDSLTLFLRNSFEQGEEVLYPNLVGIASDIVQKCEGNPLFLMTVGSSLRMETDEWKWDDVEDHDMWNSNQDDKISPALSVSYERLPSNLKVCLAYCSIFPKGCAIEIDKLIQLWVAEGLISQSDRSEDLDRIGIR